MPVPGVEELPSIVELDLGVREYWYEGFRRVIVVPDSDGCVLLSVDVYRRGAVGGDAGAALDTGANGGLALEYRQVEMDGLEIRGQEPSMVEAVVLRVNGRVETINVRLRYCGLPSVPNYEEVAGVYKRLVSVIEERSVDEAPLSPPAPVERVYRSRGIRSGRRRRSQ